VDFNRVPCDHRSGCCVAGYETQFEAIWAALGTRCKAAVIFLATLFVD
jgi:hypothetical protein